MMTSVEDSSSTTISTPPSSLSSSSSFTMYLSEGAQKQFEEIVQSIQRDLNKLSDPTSDRTTKRRSLDRIQKELSKSLQINDRSKKDEDNKLVEAVLEVVLKPMLKLLGDSVEKCREGALEVLRSFTPRISSPQPFLPYIIPVLVSRLTPVEIVEPSEEIRLSLIEYLFDLIVLSGKDVALFVDDVVAIVDRVLADGFQDVRKIACRIVIETAKLSPQRFALHSAAVLKALSPSLGHRHSAVRIITLQAISQSLKADCSAFTDTYPAIKKLLLDKSNQVRQTLYTMATDLLVNLIDRHVYGFQLVPILLAGMSDEIPELRDLCKNGTVQAGERYVLDNEKNVKDEQDWQEVLGVDRPPLGTRKLVQSNLSKIVNLILEDLQDWNLETRIKSVQMLRHCVHYGEGHITGFLVAILNGFAKIVNGEPELLQELLLTATELSRYVAPSIYLNIFLPLLKTMSTSSRIPSLQILSHLISGSRLYKAAGNSDQSYWSLEDVRNVIEVMADREFVGNENSDVVYRVAEVMKALVDIILLGFESGKINPVTQRKNEDAVNMEEGMRRQWNDVVYEIWKGSMQLLSLNIDVTGSSNGSGKTGGLRSVTTGDNLGNDIQEMAASILATLSKVHSVLSRPSSLPTSYLQPLYNAYTPLYLQTLLESNSMQSWNRYSNEPKVLSTVLVQCGADVLRSNLNQVITVLQVALGSELNGTRSEEDKEKEKEWEVRLCLLNTLFQILYLLASSSSAPSHSTSTSPSSLPPHLPALLQNVFVPLATWKAGPHNTVTRLRCFQCLEVLFGCFEPTSFALSSSAVSLSLTSLSGLSVPPVPKLSFASSDRSEGNLTLNCLITTDSFEHEYEINGKKKSLRKRFLKTLIGSIEDDEAITRVACLRVIKKWFELEIENGQARFDENHLKEVYPEVLSRLDDSLDAIRIQACRTLIGLLTYLKKNQEKLKLDGVHGKEITKMVVVHVDDTREDVANAACDVVATTSLIYPQIVKDYLNSVKVKYRNKGMIEKLVSEIVV